MGESTENTTGQPKQCEVNVQINQGITGKVDAKLGDNTAPVEAGFIGKNEVKANVQYPASPDGDCNAMAVVEALLRNLELSDKVTHDTSGDSKPSVVPVAPNHVSVKDVGVSPQGNLRQ